MHAIHPIARWIERHAGILLTILLLAAFWHPAGREEVLGGPSSDRPEGGSAASGRHLLAPDAHRILVEKSEHRLLLFRGNSLLAVYPIQGADRQPGAVSAPDGRFVVSGLTHGKGQGAELYLTWSDRVGADRALSSGMLDRAAHDRVLQSLAEGELPPESEPWGRTFSIHGSSPAAQPERSGVPLEDEYVLQLVELVRIGTPVEIR